MSDFTGSGKPRLSIRHEDSLVHVTFPTGRIGGPVVRELYDVAAQLVTGPDTKLLMDLTDVSFINSAGIGMMVTFQSRCMNCGARFHLVIPSAEVRHSFEIMHLHKILNIFETQEEATAAFEAS